MAAPTPYARAYGFENYQSLHPSDPLPGDQVDVELDAIAAYASAVVARLALIQRSDGALLNGSVTTDSLAASVTALFTAVGVTPRGAWLTATAYTTKDIATQSGAVYMCVTGHTSGTFATDLAAGKWVVLSNATANQSLNTTDSPTFAAMTLSGALAAGGALAATLSANGGVSCPATNSNAGTAAYIEWRVANGTSVGVLRQFGASFATSGINRANGTLVEASGGGGLTLSSQSSDVYVAIGGVERARFMSSLGGSLLVGTTSAVANMDATGGQIGAARGIYLPAGIGVNWDAVTRINATAGSAINCLVNANGVSLLLNAAAWSATSDYRAKNVLGAFEGAGAIIDAIPVHLAEYKNGLTPARAMFLAHEVAAGGAGFAVRGEKDAVDPETGEPVLQKLESTDPLVAVLWAEVRALRARMAALEAK